MKYLYKSILFFVLLLFLVACGNDESEMIQKKWAMDADEMLKQLPEEERKLLTKEDKATFKELMAELYVEFKEDGIFENNMKGETMQGTWQLSENLLITKVDERQDTLKVLEITEDKLVLSPQGEKQKLILTAAK